MKSRYYFEIDVSDRTTDHYAPWWANYGTIIAEGNSLEECLETASVDITDQDGGEIDVVSADENWMQDAIECEFLNDPDRNAEHLRNHKIYTDTLTAEMEREHGDN